MSKKAQLIWNFNGQCGLKTADHHLLYLKEFAKNGIGSYYKIMS